MKLITYQIPDNRQFSIKSNDWKKEFNGYTDYFKIGNNIDLINERELNNEIQSFLKSLDPKYVYSVLAVIKNHSLESDDVKIINRNAIKITNKNTPKSIGLVIGMGLNQYFNNYGAGNNDNLELTLMSKIWLSESEFKSSKDEIVSTLEEVLLDSCNENNRKRISERINLKGCEVYTNTTPGNYGIEITNFDSFECIESKLPNSKVYRYSEQLYVEVIYKNNTFNVDVLTKNEDGNVTFSQHPTISWVDTEIERK